MCCKFLYSVTPRGTIVRGKVEVLLTDRFVAVKQVVEIDFHVFDFWEHAEVLHDPSVILDSASHVPDCSDALHADVENTFFRTITHKD